MLITCLLPTGIKKPYAWDPEIVPIQVFKIGSLVIAAPPAEFTTMAGRRLKRTMKSVFGDDVRVVIAGLSNTYSSYVTTFEEYQEQRYEAGSTVFGPHTLTAYLNLFEQVNPPTVTTLIIYTSYVTNVTNMLCSRWPSRSETTPPLPRGPAHPICTPNRSTCCLA